MSLRKVRVISTVGTKIAEIETEANVFSQLKTELSSKGYNLSSTKVIEGDTQLTLEQDGAKLPVTDFTIFIVPVKTKSGADWSKAGYKELRAEIKSIKDKIDESKFKAAFGNYTQSSTEQLQKLVVAYYKKNTPSTNAPVATKSVAPVVKKVVPTKELIDIPALKPIEGNVTINIPVSLIPAGVYSRLLTEQEIAAVQKVLK